MTQEEFAALSNSLSDKLEVHRQEIISLAHRRMDLDMYKEVRKMRRTSRDFNKLWQEANQLGLLDQ